MMAGAIIAFAGLCIVLVEKLHVEPYAVLLLVGLGLFGLGIIRRLTHHGRRD